MGALENLVDLDDSLRGLQALLDHVGRKLELTKSHEVTSNEVQDLVIANVVLELEDVLDKVVAIGVLNKNMDAADNNISKLELLRDEALLKAALHNAAAVLVGANLVAVVHAGLEDELRVGGEGLSACAVALLWRVRCLEGQQELLDNMVAIGVGRQVEDVVRHLGAEGQDLLMESRGLLAEHLDESLNGASAVKIHGDLDYVG
mmetsp:Transcript_20253/g.27379  ORF Transcript_20253/g.27379 Transcript_20253/m.27379 type:complete len:204 (-) Transcript_20253:1684-2295(-)